MIRPSTNANAFKENGVWRQHRKQHSRSSIATDEIRLSLRLEALLECCSSYSTEMKILQFTTMVPPTDTIKSDNGRHDTWYVSLHPLVCSWNDGWKGFWRISICTYVLRRIVSVESLDWCWIGTQQKRERERVAVDTTLSNEMKVLLQWWRKSNTKPWRLRSSVPSTTSHSTN